MTVSALINACGVKTSKAAWRMQKRLLALARLAATKQKTSSKDLSVSIRNLKAVVSSLRRMMRIFTPLLNDGSRSLLARWVESYTQGAVVTIRWRQIFACG